MIYKINKNDIFIEIDFKGDEIGRYEEVYINTKNIVSIEAYWDTELPKFEGSTCADTDYELGLIINSKFIPLIRYCNDYYLDKNEREDKEGIDKGKYDDKMSEAFNKNWDKICKIRDDIVRIMNIEYNEERGNRNV